MSDSDGVHEALQQETRVALAAAARLGEALMRQLQRAREESRAAAQANARDAQVDLERSRDIARSRYVGVHDMGWWEAARPDDIATAYTHARGWSGTDPEADRAADRIVREVKARYDVDLTDSDLTRAGAALVEAEQRLATQTTQQGPDRALVDLVKAERADQAAQHGATSPQAEDLDPDVSAAEQQAANTDAGVDAAAAGVDDADADLATTADQAEAIRSESPAEVTREDLAGVTDQAAVDARVTASKAYPKPAHLATRTDQGSRKGRPSPAARRASQRGRRPTTVRGR